MKKKSPSDVYPRKLKGSHQKAYQAQLGRSARPSRDGDSNQRVSPLKSAMVRRKRRNRARLRCCIHDSETRRTVAKLSRASPANYPIVECKQNRLDKWPAIKRTEGRRWVEGTVIQARRNSDVTPRNAEVGARNRGKKITLHRRRGAAGIPREPANWFSEIGNINRAVRERFFLLTEEVTFSFENACIIINIFEIWMLNT